MLPIRSLSFLVMLTAFFATASANPPQQASESNAYGVYTLRSFFPDEPAVKEAPMPRDKTVAVACCGLDEAQPGDPEPAIGPKLGREIPDKQYDYGNFRAVVGKDGKTRYFPRIGKFIDSEKKKAPPPAAINYGAKAPNVLKKMYLNDRYGCCVISSRAHQFGVVNAVENGVEVFASDSEILSTYRGFCGGGDNGCNMAAVNQLQQTTGMSIAGKVRKTRGSVSVDNTNPELVKTMIVVSGGLNIGMNLPQTWFSSADGTDWTPTNSRIVGGHETQAFGYDDKGVLISTWAGQRRITWSAFTSRKWIDECYASLLPEWYEKDGIADNGIDKAGLELAFAEVADGKVPVLPDPKPPTPPQPPVTPPVTPPITPPTTTGFTGTLTYSNGTLVSVTGGSVTPPVNPPVTPPVIVPPTPGSANPALEELKNRIAKAQARKDGAGIRVSPAELAAARAKLEAAISDEALTQLAVERKIPVVKDGNKAGPLSDFFEWIIANQDKIAAFIEFIIKIISGIG